METMGTDDAIFHKFVLESRIPGLLTLSDGFKVESHQFRLWKITRQNPTHIHLPLSPAQTPEISSRPAEHACANAAEFNRFAP